VALIRWHAAGGGWQPSKAIQALNKALSNAMAWILIIGMALTGIGILVGLYLPILAAHFATPDKIRLYAIIGAALVVIGMACEVVAVWPVAEVELEQQSD
jgi:steroid 5-alpha reductase family enzyme